MTAVMIPSGEFAVNLTEEERSQLLSFLENSLRNTHVEARRTEAPAYQQLVHHQEKILRGLIGKLRRPEETATSQPREASSGAK